MIYGVECTNEFNLDVWCIFSNLMDYGKSPLWSWGIGWLSYASKWDYRSLLGAYVKWIFEYSMSLVVELSRAF